MDCLRKHNLDERDHVLVYPRDAMTNKDTPRIGSAFDREFNIHASRLPFKRRLRDSMLIYSEHICLINRRRRQAAMQKIAAEREAVGAKSKHSHEMKSLQRLTVSENAARKRGRAGMVSPLPDSVIASGKERLSVSEGDVKRSKQTKLSFRGQYINEPMWGKWCCDTEAADIKGMLTGDCIAKPMMVEEPQSHDATQQPILRTIAITLPNSEENIGDVGFVKGTVCSSATKPIPTNDSITRENTNDSIVANAGDIADSLSNSGSASVERNSSLKEDTHQLLREAMDHLKRVKLAKVAHDDMMKKFQHRQYKVTRRKRKPVLEAIPENDVTNSVITRQRKEIKKVDADFSSKRNAIVMPTATDTTGCVLVGDSCKLNLSKDDGNKTKIVTNGHANDNSQTSGRQRGKKILNSDRSFYNSLLKPRDIFKLKSLQTYANREYKFRKLRYLKDV